MLLQPRHITVCRLDREPQFFLRSFYSFQKTRTSFQSR